MPIAVTDPSLKTDPPRKRWTRADYESLSTAVLREGLELVDGELISKMGKKRPHVIGLNRLRGWLDRTFGREFVNSEAPIDVAAEDNPSNEPAPDLIVSSVQRRSSWATRIRAIFTPWWKSRTRPWGST